MYVTNFRLETPDVTLVNSSLPPSAVPLCQARVRPHIVNAQFEAASDALVSLKSVPMVCTQAAFVDTIGVIGNLTSACLSPIVCVCVCGSRVLCVVCECVSV